MSSQQTYHNNRHSCSNWYLLYKISNYNQENDSNEPQPDFTEMEKQWIEEDNRHYLEK